VKERVGLLALRRTYNHLVIIVMFARALHTTLID
jgi:hypothetical protein